MYKSKVVIGTWPLSGDLGNVDKKNVYKILEYCVKIGFTEFDTAPNYGGNFMESCLGDIFAGNNDIRINTKCGSSAGNNKDFSNTALKKSLDNSLKRLRRNSIHILFLHNPRKELPNFSPAINFFNSEKVNGRILYGGLSAAKGYKYNLSQYKQLDVLQDDVNLLFLDGLLNYKGKNNSFYARSPLATGILSGKMTENTIFESNDYRASWLKGNRLKSILKRVSAIQKLSEINLSSLARRFVLQLSNVDKVIFGVKSQQHVDDLIKDINAPLLDDNLVHQLIRLQKEDFGLYSKEKSLGY